VNFTAAGCKTTAATLEGAVNLEVLNSKKEAVAVGEHEKAEADGFVKVFSGEACKVAKRLVHRIQGGRRQK
jgi:formylmethanofuran dehydrogenase subunit E-like metal-binding protein